MPPRIITILSRLRQDVAAAISAKSILSACNEVGYHWRNRLLGPVETIHLFLLQVLLKNTACCSHGHLAMLIVRGVYGGFPMQPKLHVDFTPGRSKPRSKGAYSSPQGLSSSRWVLAHGPLDQVVEWFNPKRCPAWMSADEYAKLPETILVRELRYKLDAIVYNLVPSVMLELARTQRVDRTWIGSAWWTPSAG